MAITIQATPATYSSVHDDLIYTVAEVVKTADPVTYPNYKFIADVYVDGVLVARIKKVPNPTTRIGVFNIGQIVRNYLATTFNPQANVLYAQSLGSGQFRVSVLMKFGEEYDLTSYYNLTLDATRIFTNHYNARLVGLSSGITPFTNKVASSRPLTSQAMLDSEYIFLPYFATTTTPFNVLCVAYGGGSGFSITVTPAPDNSMVILNVGPGAINSFHSGAITVDTTHYTITIGSAVYRFDMICEPQYTPYTLHFLNKYGGFESKIFQKVSRKTLDIQRKDFGKLPYTVDVSGVVAYKNANKVYNESRSVYSAQYKEKLTLNSDLLTDEEYTWLSDLLLSPMVYIEDGGYFFPCVITENNYEPKKVINDDLTNLTISIEYGQQLNSQFR